MQDTLLRVFVVALSLLMQPRHDPGVKEGDDMTLREHEDRMLRQGEKLDQEMPSVHQMMQTDAGAPQDSLLSGDREGIEATMSKESNQHTAEKDQMQVPGSVNNEDSEDDTANHRTPEDGYSNSVPSLLEKPESDLATELKNSDVNHEDQTEVPRVKGSSDLSQGQQEVFSSQEAPLHHLHTETSEDEGSEMTLADWERDYLWCIWNIFSLISMIRFCRKYLKSKCQMKQTAARACHVTCSAVEVRLPDSDTLLRFYSKCLQVPSSQKWEDAFLEGFMNDLLESMRAVCSRNGGMIIEDFQLVDVCDFIAPLSPPEPYSFQCRLWNTQTADPLTEMQDCGQIKLVENETAKHGCHCQSADGDDDVVCLLHCEKEQVKTKPSEVCDGPLCVKSSPFLSKSKVTRWFQNTIRHAWREISHKYEFELNIRAVDAAGALEVRFRSGRKISFNMGPVVRLNSDAHLYITPCCPNDLDDLWTLSLTVYEDRFLDQISKRLPENSCHIQTLKIVYFLHKNQTRLSGSSALKDHHFKTALMHLLLTKDPSQWKPNYVGCRLQDLLVFIERSLEKQLLHHTLIGNPLIQKVLELPVEFTRAQPVNLFHPLVVHNCIYRNAVMHFQEILRNADMLILDYVGS